MTTRVLLCEVDDVHIVAKAILEDNNKYDLVDVWIS